jgi:hypothetical protein
MIQQRIGLSEAEEDRTEHPADMEAETVVEMAGTLPQMIGMTEMTEGEGDRQWILVWLAAVGRGGSESDL